MANEEHVRRLRAGVDAWNRWRREHVSEVLDLRDADLSGADLSGAFLAGADLAPADLTRANLTWVDLSDADLSGADLSGVDLTRANFSRTHLAGADFSAARMSGTLFAAIDLREAKGLDNVLHDGPSTIGIDTLYKSRGRIPDSFLRGCGVPDEFIRYARSLIGKAIEFYSCFISYSSKDQEFAERLYADLQAKGVRCWFAPKDMQGGRKVERQIDEAIRVHEKLLLVLSDSSIASDWVRTEIRKACKREKAEKRQILFPVALVPFERLKTWESFCADLGEDLAEEVREYHIPDFTNWKDHDSYQSAFGRLLRDLKADTDK